VFAHGGVRLNGSLYYEGSALQPVAERDRSAAYTGPHAAPEPPLSGVRIWVSSL